MIAADAAQFKDSGFLFSPELAYAYWDGFAATDRWDVARAISNTPSISCVAFSKVATPNSQEILDLLNKNVNEWTGPQVIRCSGAGSACFRSFLVFHKQICQLTKKPCLRLTNASSVIERLHAHSCDLLMSMLEWNINRQGHRIGRRSFNLLDYVNDLLEIGEVFHNHRVFVGTQGQEAILGQGGFGVVVRLLRRSEHYVACKIQQVGTNFEVNDSKDSLLRESNILNYCAKEFPRSTSGFCPAPKLTSFHDGFSSFARVTASSGNIYSLLCMDLCFCDSTVLREEFTAHFSSTGEIPDRHRLFFEKLAFALGQLHTRSLAHGDIKFENVALYQPWVHGSQLFLRIIDWGTGVLGSPNREYVDKNQNSPSAPVASVASRRAITAVAMAKVKQHPKCAEKKCGFGALSREPIIKFPKATFYNQEQVATRLNKQPIDDSCRGTEGYRLRNREDVDLSFTGAKYREREATPALHHKRRQDMISLAAMMMETIHPMDNRIAYERKLSELGMKTAADVEMFLLRKESAKCSAANLGQGPKQPLAISRLSQLLHKMLTQRSMAVLDMCKTDYFQFPVLTREQESKAANEGIEVEGGVPSWASGTPCEGMPLPNVKIKFSSTKKSLGVFIIGRAPKGTLLGFYSGKYVFMEDSPFTKYGLPLREGDQQMIDGAVSSE